uniref:NADH dehydrogenase subunit 5 n=1 Tax=Micrarionta opuntia TaxID=2914219 RepID=UPI001EF9E063|nr:NADH dehydrogenase subunit 5 [Micrarionta opuntia]UKG20823.1 NADH dehydrogenase subunit 5 [Micrarionta opuntia]
MMFVLLLLNGGVAYQLVRSSWHRLTVLLLLMMSSYSMFYLCNSLAGHMGYLFHSNITTISTFSFSGDMIFDTMSLSFSWVVTMISFCVFLFARYYMAQDLHYYRFMWLLFLFVLSMNVLIFSGSLFILLVGWDGLGVSSFLLIIYYQSYTSLEAGVLTLMINRVGDILIMSLLFYLSIAGFSYIMYYPTTEMYIMLSLLTLAAMTKSAQYPFSVWLPAAMAAPTPVSALVHSSTLVTAGIYILIRAASTMPFPLDVNNLLLFTGAITSFIGGSCAVYENDLKKVIALSTLSQLGVMVFSLGLTAPTLALLHLYTHAMFKALLFLVAGCILMLAYGTQDMRLLGGVTQNNPLLLVFMNISTFCLMGLPFLSAFYSKHLILSVMWSSHINIFSCCIMLISVGLTSVYMIRMLKSLNWTTNNSVILCSPFLVLLPYTPLVLLFVGSLFLGHFLSVSDMSYSFYNLFPFWCDLFLYSLLCFGVGSGLLIHKYKGSYMLTSMYYMDPVWKKSIYMYFPFSKTLKVLDYGWLEPYVYSVSLSKLSTYLFKLYYLMHMGPNLKTALGVTVL